MTIAQSFQAGLDYFKQGNLGQAGALFQQVIAADPQHFHARHLLGVTRHQEGRNEEALEWIGAALALHPNFPQALLNYGFVLKVMGRPQEAIVYYDKAIALKPDYAEAYNNRGAALQGLGRLGEALGAYDHAIAIQPGHAGAHNNRGNVLQEMGRTQEALAAYDRAIALKPDYAEALYNRGNTLQSLRRADDALASYDRAIQLKPDHAQAFNNRGIVLQDLRRLEAALASCRQAVQLLPGYADAHSNIGNILGDLKRFDAALAAHAAAVALEPANARVQMNKAMAELLTGDFENGWKDFEWRRKIAELSRAKDYAPPPLISLVEAQGKTVLVHYEHGLGDTIQFCRYIEPLARAGAKVLFAPQKQLRSLMAPLQQWCDFADADAPAAPFDYHIPVMSLPLLFAGTADSLPARMPYLFADEQPAALWRAKLGSTGFKIGICWKGNAAHQRVDRRCFPLRLFEPLAKLPGVRLISLQKGEGAEELENLPPGMTVERLGTDFDSGPDAFVDTAAVMSCLDLVITTETSIAHLAGALGAPTWVALQYVPDWRWMLERDDSPWYPSVRLFRQQTDQDWTNVFQHIQLALTSLLPD